MQHLRPVLGAFVVSAAVSLAGCPKSDGPERAEAGRVSRAIDALRTADNAEKPNFLRALRAEQCVDAEVCSVRSACLAAYELHVGSLERVAQAGVLVDAGDPSAAASAFTQARDDLDRARRLAEDCTRAQGELIRNKRL
jgi:hypothetical protein